MPIWNYECCDGTSISPTRRRRPAPPGDRMTPGPVMSITEAGPQNVPWGDCEKPSFELAGRTVTAQPARASTACRAIIERRDRPLLRMGTRQGQTRAKVGDAKPTGLPRAHYGAFARPAGLPNGPPGGFSSCRSGYISAAR